LHDPRQRHPGLGGFRHWRPKQNNAEARGWTAAPSQFAKILVKGEYHSARLKGARQDHFICLAGRDLQHRFHPHARLSKGSDRSSGEILVGEESYHAAGG
jgi:hypothetical protein